MFEASRARSQRSRSSRSSASIIDWSSARCWGVIERRSDCIAAIRWVSCSTMSSSVRAPGKKRPCLARKSSTSSWRARGPRAAPGAAGSGRGPSPGSRRAPRASFLDRVGQAVDELVEHLLAEPLASASKRSRAAGSMKSYSSSPRIRPPTSAAARRAGRGRRAAASRSISARRRGRSPPVSPGVAAASPPRRGGLDAGPLLGDDLVELVADVGEHITELVAVRSSSRRRRGGRAGREAGEVAAGRVARPPAPLHQPPEGLLEVALGHHVVGQRIQDLVGVEVRDGWLPSQRA